MNFQLGDVNFNLDSSQKEENINDHQCGECGGRFKTKRILTRHKARKNCEQPFQCKGCSKSFKLEAMLKNHKKYCAGTTHECEDCGKVLKTYTQLRWHLELHADANAFGCDFCDYKATRPADLRKHKKNMHGEVEDYVCETCGDIFNNPVSLKSHNNIHLGVQVFQCDCGKVFKRKDSLERHQASHMPKENHFSCPVCQKTFARIDNLKMHIESHRKNAIPCPECEFSFTNLHKLRAHIDSTHIKKEV